MSLDTITEKVNYIYEKEIRLKNLFFSLSKNKKFLGAWLLSGLLIGLIHAFFTKPTWQGQFQIVLTEKKDNRNSLFSSSEPDDLAQLLSGGRSSKNLKTEVEILRSPSVLMPIYKYIEQNKRDSGMNTDKWEYTNWLDKNLNIKLKKDTSVLTLEYFDKDKELIKPVLNKISDAYQIYSKKDFTREIDNALEYLSEQINLYREKRITSLRNAQGYALKENLAVLQGLSEGDDEIVNSLDLERMRIESSLEIKKIDEQLKQLKNLNDPDELMFFGRNIPALDEEGLPNKLDEIDSKLFFLRTYYNENDKTIQDTLLERKITIENLKRQSIGYLNAARKIAEAKRDSAVRPEGVIIKYKELLNNYVRDKKTLEKLESDFQILSLEKARKEDPWQLITESTINKFPTFPNKKNSVLIGSILGIILGSLNVFIIEKRKNLVLNHEELQNILDIPILFQFRDTDENISSEFISLLSQRLSSLKTKKLSLINLSQTSNENCKLLIEKLNDQIPNIDISEKNNFLNSSNSDLIYLLITLGTSSYNDLNLLKQKIDLQDNKVSGIILI